MDKQEIVVTHFVREALYFDLPKEIVGEEMNKVVVIAEPVLCDDDRSQMIWRIWCEVNDFPARYGVGEVLSEYFANVTLGTEVIISSILKDEDIIQNIHLAITQTMFTIRKRNKEAAYLRQKYDSCADHPGQETEDPPRNRRVRGLREKTKILPS